MSLFFLIVAIVLFLLAAFASLWGGDAPLAPLELAYFGLAAFAAAHLPLSTWRARG